MRPEPRAVGALSAALTFACGGVRTEPGSAGTQTVPAEPAITASPGSVAPIDAGIPPQASLSEPSAEAGAAKGECPSDMAHVKKEHCPKLERKCLKDEYDKANHITICHRFDEGSPRCLEPRVALDFCIDHYEFPNQKGARPPVMVDWYNAMGQCAAQGKRLCYESEWVAACEGPNDKPFPYGYVRSAEKCNIDNAWIDPSLNKIYSNDPAISGPELARLDRSVPSGSKPGCVSDYGVFDLTGNVDEWVLADFDRPKEKAKFTALKGGAWGHVRNACRPVTTSHEPEFRYYFVSFRCCTDPASMKPFVPAGK
jgi:sulfatase modifying factor 1